MNKEIKWISRKEIFSYLEEYEFGTELSRLYAISNFWNNAVYPEVYEANKEWPKILTLSDYGHSVYEIVNSKRKIISESDLIFILFKIFSYHHLFFDQKSIDIDAVEDILKSELQDDKIFLPFLFGRLLYDRFNDNYIGEGTDHLNNQEVMNLISGTPKGIYQLDKYLTGPLGLIYSIESRYLPPSLCFSLWHCSDTGCFTPHQVDFLPPDSLLTKLGNIVKHILKEKLGPPSDWHYALSRRYLARRDYEEKPLAYSDTAIFIADSIIGNERTMLLTYALKREIGGELRNILSSPPRRRISGEGKPESIASSLSPEEQLQLILFLPDTMIVDLIDELTETGCLSIPFGQRRRAKHSPPPTSSLNIPCELSRLGMRSTEEAPIVTIVSFIYSAYMEQGLQGDLQWRLKSSVGIPIKEALVGYVREKGPEMAIQELVLSSPDITKIICDKIRLSLNRFSLNLEETIDRIIWKMGFNPPQYNDFCKRFLSHLEGFNKVLLTTPSLEREDERENIRAAGVNLFVYLEKFIDNLISYNIWLLSSDHFLNTLFNFNLSDARGQVGRVLGETLTTGDTTVNWHAKGENSLGVLLSYLDESIRWIDSMQTIERDRLKRPDGDIPHFAGAYISRFPFYHTELWADCEPSQLRSYQEGYFLIISNLQKAELAYVRNGLDHMRDASRFPTIEKMLACISRIREAFNIAIMRRYLPEVWWFEKKDEDKFGTITYYLNDALGQSLILHGPEMLQCIPNIPTDSPVLVAPANLLGEPNAPIVFTLRNDTEYDLYWRGFPRRRHIPPFSDEITYEAPEQIACAKETAE